MLVLGTTAAATLSFTAARGVGRRYAQKMLQTELGKGKGEGGANGMMAKQLTKVTAAIENGSVWQQFLAVAALRLTPVVPFRCVATYRYWLKCIRTL